MQFRGMVFLTGVCWMAGLPALAQQQSTPPAQPAQTAQPAQGASEPAATFHTETRLVPVDVVVKDKKDNYVRDLTKKDFKVSEDGKEQEITTFSFGADPNAPGSAQQRYLVLFFDNSTMNMGDQIRARTEAAKFIDANASPERLMAVVNFGGSLVISQNFTDNAERLKAAVTGARTSAVSPNMGSGRGMGGGGGGGGMGGRTMGSMGAYGARDVILAVRSMAENLMDIPGRKILILFSAGFPLRNNPELISEITAAIDSCNHSNVAIYPIDVRGLVSGPLRLGGAVMNPPAGPEGAPVPFFTRSLGIALALNPVLRIAAFQARGGGGGTTGGGTTGGGTGGSTGGAGGGRSGSTGGTTGSSGTGTTGGTRSAPGSTSGSTSGSASKGGGGGGGTTAPVVTGSPRTIMPRIPEGVSANQDVLYMLAGGTGGFVIANTNDLLKGMESIGKEQNEYYFLGYAPPESKEGSCHTIHVKVDRGGTSVRARSGYCNVKSKDALAGKPIETQLETRITGSQAPTVAAPLQAAYFYSGANTARVTVALAIPASAVKFEKVKGKFHGEINVLGLAYRSASEVGARFSDTVKLDYEKKDEVEEFAAKPYLYENQFEVTPGKYNLKVVFNSGGQNFGKQEIPLAIDTYDGTEYSMSALAPTKNFRKMDANDPLANSHIDAELIEGKTPMIVGSLEFTPAAAYSFKAADQVAVYFEVYDSLLAAEETPAAPPAPAAAPAQPADPLGLHGQQADAAPAGPAKKVLAELRILDRQTGETKLDSGGVDISNFIRKGNPVMAIALAVPVKDLKPGGYRLEIRSSDWEKRSIGRTVDFDIE